MNRDSLKKIQEVRYEEIKYDLLVDINEINIDTKKNITERIENFIDAVNNPYVIKCGNTIVEIEFTDTNKTIESQITNYLKSLKSSDLSCRIW